MPRKEAKLGSFERLLRRPVTLDDQEWAFAVPDLPAAARLNAHGLVKAVSLATKGADASMTLKLTAMEENRATKGQPLDRFVLLSLSEFRAPRGPAPETTGGTRPTTPRECTDYVVRMLRAGIIIEGVHYHFFGHSNSQLKSRTCLLYAAPKGDISRIIESLGDFAKMKTVGKKAKRIGLLFSTAKAALTVEPGRCEDIPDIEVRDYVFTDGCGLVAPRFAQELARRLRLTFRDARYSPSVFQIRYRGYKGVVTVDPTMRQGPTVLKFRKSMKKFSGGADLSFAVVDYSKPYAFGHLNDEVVVLLSALGVPVATLMRKQQEHLDFLQQAVDDPRQAFRFLCYVNQPALAEAVLTESLAAVRPRVAALVHGEYAKMLNKRDEQRCRILVPQSRLLFGVCDAWGVLREGECAVKVTLERNGQPYALRGTDVLVTRNPCLHPGDLQKFRVVARDELAHLVDCIVFPAQGRRPAADLMSGGDLDGDTFFVCWDGDLVPSLQSVPAAYPGAREPLKFQPITDDDRLVYFAKYNSASLGRVKNLYMDWARAKGAMAAECQELNRLFSQCVDGNRINIPPRLEKTPPTRETADAASGEPQFILDRLHEAAKQTIAQRQNQVPDVQEYSFEALELLLARDDVAMSEFELVQLVARWCSRNDASLQEFLPYFDLNILAADEKAWILAHLPPAERLPSWVLNAVCTSRIVAEAELRPFRLDDHRLGWKRVYDSARDRLATFLDAATWALAGFHKTLLVLRVDARLALALYVPQRIARAQDGQVDDRARVFAFPHSKDPGTLGRLALPTKKNYRLYCDENALQLFEGQRANTWIFIGRSPSDDSAYRNTRNAGDRRRQRQATLDAGQNFDCRVSVALDKFSRGLQTHIGRVNRNGVTEAEIYVISNRDVKSMQALDLWLDYVETDETLPLFSQEPQPYDVATLASVDWNGTPAITRRLVQDADLSVLAGPEATQCLPAILAWLLQYDQKGLLIACYDFLLSNLPSDQDGLGTSSVQLGAMLDFLKDAPFLALQFAGLASWGSDTMAEAAALTLQNRGSEILHALIVSARTAGHLVVGPFQAALRHLDDLSLDRLARLVELCALAVASPDLAADLLLAGLAPAGPRLVGGDAVVVGHFIRHAVAVALEHVTEAEEEQAARPDLLAMTVLDESIDGYPVVEVAFRIDASSAPENGAHVHLVVAPPPDQRPGTPVSVDALVVRSQQGTARFQCFHPLPPFAGACSWRLTHCGSFVTAKTMLAALRAFARDDEAACGLTHQLLGLPSIDSPLPATEPIRCTPKGDLNTSQSRAVDAALNDPLVCLWGPPGTGKTQTIVEMIIALQDAFPDERILVTAPTHNAVDNVMRRYLAMRTHNKEEPPALRVSTEVRKVGEDLRSYTCDALAGVELNASHAAQREAQRRVGASRLVFTTCIGAGLGLLRKQAFAIVVVDEASQQTEPAALVPLVKGCRHAILVGDHVQLRPTVRPLAAALGYDVSLFERLYTTHNTVAGMCRVMLDTQYRMHPALAHFSAEAFYEGRLQTGLEPESRPMAPSAFPWPREDAARAVFIECTAREDLGGKSKKNPGQAALCRTVCTLLCTPPPPPDHSIVVLTPYTGQITLLRTALAGLAGDIEVASVDGFQGREADVVVFVTVRCNERGETGFLRDLRRLNVALTRARAGLVVLGNRRTLTMRRADGRGGVGDSVGEDDSAVVWGRLLEGLREVTVEGP